MAAIEDFLADAKRRMDRSIEATHQEFNSIRTGRASPALLDHMLLPLTGGGVVLLAAGGLGLFRQEGLAALPEGQATRAFKLTAGVRFMIPARRNSGSECTP